MKRITLVSLLFCLAITTVFPKLNGSTTNIATPNSNGLSNNQVSDLVMLTQTALF